MNKKLLAGILFLGLSSFAHAEELRPQFRVWKSSFLGINPIAETQIATSPIIFHMVYGSATMNLVKSRVFCSSVRLVRHCLCPPKGL